MEDMTENMKNVGDYGVRGSGYQVVEPNLNNLEARPHSSLNKTNFSRPDPLEFSIPGCSPTNEAPIFILRRKRGWYWAAFILSIAVLLFNIFGVLIPVLTTGDYAAVWPVSDKRIGYKRSLFYMGWFYLLLLPSIFRCMRSGEFHFYKDRFEDKPILPISVRKYLYNEVAVNNHGGHRLTIYTKYLPDWKHPIQYLKAIYFDGISVPLSNKGYVNPENVPKALEILKTNAAKYNNKILS